MRRSSPRLVLAILALAAFAVASPVAAADLTAVRSNVAPAACTAGSAACPIRISFSRGAYSGQASSSLTGVHDQKWFVLNARAGQNMIIIVKGAGPTRGIVYFPNGQYEGQPGGRVFDGNLPVSGDYKIQVTEDSMAQQWSGRVTVVAVIY